jgi:hypothetical protein
MWQKPAWVDCATGHLEPRPTRMDAMRRNADRRKVWVVELTVGVGTRPAESCGTPMGVRTGAIGPPGP